METLHFNFQTTGEFCFLKSLISHMYCIIHSPVVMTLPAAEHVSDVIASCNG